MSTASSTSDSSSSVVRIPWLLRVSPAAAGLATAAGMLLLVAGPWSPKGDMTVVVAGAQLHTEADRNSGICDQSLSGGWLLRCLRDPKGRCTTKIHDGDLYIQTSEHCWITREVVRFEDPHLALSDPEGAIAGDDLQTLVSNAWEERRRAAEFSALDELQKLFDSQRWPDLESRARQLLDERRIFSVEGRQKAENQLGEAISAEINVHVKTIEERLSRLELDIWSIKGSVMKKSQRENDIRKYQSETSHLSEEVESIVEGLKAWKERSALVEFRLQIARKRLFDLRDRAFRAQQDLGRMRP